MGDIEAALAFVATRQARRAMPAQEWANVLSFDLGWMSPMQARGLLARAQLAGVLMEEDGQLRLAFDPASIAVPTLFRPRTDAEPDAGTRAAPAEGFPTWLETYVRHARCERPEALRRVAQRQEQMHGLLTAEAALLWLAAESGLDVRSAAARLIGR